MKLRRELIDRISYRVAGVLLKEGLVAGVEEPDLAGRVARAVTDDLMVEDRLNEEVRELLRQHMDKIDRANVEYHEMFKTLKAKLVRERKLIL
jgi:hypothetical protein